MSVSASPRRLRYVDADWIPEDPAVPRETLGIAVEDGRLYWTDAPEDAVAVEPDEGEQRAAALLAAYAAAIAATVRDHERVEVLGAGACADLVRLQLGARLAAGERGSTAIVLHASAPAEIRSSLARLRDLGTLVLACPGNPGEALNLYEHLHRRGLRMLGAPRPSPAEAARATDEIERLGSEARAAIVSVASLESAPPRGWVRVTGTS